MQARHPLASIMDPAAQCAQGWAWDLGRLPRLISRDFIPSRRCPFGRPTHSILRTLHSAMLSCTCLLTLKSTMPASVRYKPVACSLDSPIQRVVPPILVIEACAATPRASVRLSVLEIQSDGDPDTGRIAPSCSCNTASMSRCMTTLGMVPISHHAPHTADCRSSTSSFVKVVLVLAAASRTPPTSSIRAWTRRSTLTWMPILAR